MLDSLLISFPDFAPFTDICSNIDKSRKLDPYIRQAQELDLKEVLGDEFFYSLLSDFEDSPSLGTYNDLMKGCIYEKNGATLRNPGLIPVLCYFTYSRYVISKPYTDTAFGMMQKKNEYSEPVSGRDLARLADSSRSIAHAYMSDVLKYLNSRNPSYPLWKNGCSASKNKMSIKITGVGRCH